MNDRIIKKEDGFTIFITTVDRYQTFITATVTDKNIDPTPTCEKIYHKIWDYLTQSTMDIVLERIFGSIGVESDIIKTRYKVLRQYNARQESPVTYIQGNPFWGEGLAGIQIRAIHSNKTDKGVWTIYNNGNPCGRGWKYNGATFLILQNIHGYVEQNKSEDRARQTNRMFDNANQILNAQGAKFQNVVRTWIYLSDILDWYAEFNKVRTAKYQKLHLIQDPSEDKTKAEQIYLPASTGIQGDNPIGASGTMDIYAIIPESENSVGIKPSTGIKQKSAFRYGSAFSRAMCVKEPECINILVSGTAAIDDEGKSLYPGDAYAQINKTLEIVNALIENEGANIKDICKATAFLKRPEDVPVYQKVMEEHRLKDLPAVCVVADICRDELLFELDAEVAF